MATTRTTKKAEPKTTECIVTLKKAGKTAAHFWDDEVGGFVKDMYVPTDEFKALGSPDSLKVTVEVVE
jgi:hypothetical protein